MKNPANLLYTILICLISTQVYSQGKQANIWYFGVQAGIDFNTGSPIALTNGSLSTQEGCASISSENGLLLFYTDGSDVWNRNHEKMPNGYGLYGNESSTQSAIIIPHPGNDDLYYILTVDAARADIGGRKGLNYSLVDMTLDGMDGDIVSSVKNVTLVAPLCEKVTAVNHSNGIDIWVIAQKWETNSFYCYLVTTDGINETPIISNVGIIISGGDPNNARGYMKASPDGTKIVKANAGLRNVEVFDFDNSTGIIGNVFSINIPDTDPYGIEFSPNSSLLYIGSWQANYPYFLYQFNLEAGSIQEIINSEVLIATGTQGALQLGPDYKIYVAQHNSNYISVINDPNEIGLDCNFQFEAINLDGKICTSGLPPFIQSYFKDPTFTAQHFCLGDATTFEIDNTSGIDSVYWKFNDFPNMPNDTSTQFSPEYVFSNAGTYHVDLTVYSGLLEKTVTQDITINPIPEPNLGSDTMFCNTGFVITLKPNCDGTYRWNDFSTGPELVVSDTGTYWVRATLNGCSQTDSIHIGLYPASLLDETNLSINDAGCGLPTGSISGLVVLGIAPFDYYWVDMAGDTVGINLDLSGQYAGSYALKVVDGHGCGHEFSTFIIPDNGTLVVDSVQFTPEHCNQSQATITIFTDAPSPDTFEYSIDGFNFFQNQGLFSGISAGNYHITIKDAYGCVGVYDQNPVVIDNISGPQVTSVDIIPEDNNLGNGSINIHTVGGSGDLTYSIDNGIPVVQLNNGLFNNLSAGNYLCSVTDAFGCDTTFTVYVPLVITQTLEAIAGFGSSCVGDAAVVPLELTHFTGVKSFVVTLHYDPDVVFCAGYLDLNPQLELGDFQATVQQATGEIKLTWQGQVAVTLPDQAEMLKLKFDGLGEGLSPVNWEAAPGESHFYDENHQEISAAYSTGEVRVYSLPEIQMQGTVQICTGDTTTIDPTIFGGNGQKDYTWSGPNGFSSGDTLLNFEPVTTSQAGSFTLIVEDAMKCKKSAAVELIVMESPIIAFSGYDTLFVEPGYFLDAGHDAQHYLWNTGATTEQIAIDTAGLYSVEATSGQGCKNSDAVYILWAGASFYIPNAFTPNGDGLNDVFGAIPRIDYVNQYRISIFNRWGQMIFNTSDLSQGWVGSYQGKPCQAGAYVYRIVYNDFGMGTQETKVLEGTVVLVR
ncbi:MAG: gliding motility-associated C-terminal domain-containing protein [Bacteroidales bacterium]|nr:gliding motility-associated C-terminal domain-containing protein [Bacteroidales bacterium]